jgi:hypothetical protein
MLEACFCGSFHPIDARVVIFTPEGEFTTTCPACGRRDQLGWLTPEDRLAMMKRSTLHGRVTDPVLSA